MPKISIIIPTYNSSLTITNCIESLLSQTFIDFEILIMDGISTDNTLEIVKKYKDFRINIFSERDKGVYDAMNKAIDKASGDWLYFLGSDDWLYTNNILQDVYSFSEISNSHLIYGNAYLLGKKRVYDGPFTRETLFTKQNICHQAIFYHKSVFSRLGKYNLEFVLYADWDFNLRCFSTPDLIISYADLTVVNYNDETGLSNSAVRDPYFFQSASPIAYIDRIKELECYIKENGSFLYLGRLKCRIVSFIQRSVKCFF